LLIGVLTFFLYSQSPKTTIVQNGGDFQNGGQFFPTFVAENFASSQKINLQFLVIFMTFVAINTKTLIVNYGKENQR
jgi:hypothetical protein